MVSKELVGTRIRQVRTTQRKTLKDVEAASGFSSTHISEIERGRTSPTIGALVRIAHALDKDPSYFIEERELEEVCITSQDNRPEGSKAMDVSGPGIRINGLTRGILGGRLLAYELHLDPQGDGTVDRLPETGDLCLICTQGACGITSGNRTVAVEEGDCIHLAVEDGAFSLRGDGRGPCRMVVFMDPREAIF